MASVLLVPVEGCWDLCNVEHPVCGTERHGKFHSLLSSGHYTHTLTHICQPSFAPLLFSCEVMSDSLPPHGLQHARLPVLHQVCSDSLSIESVMLFNHLILFATFSSCPQSFPALGSFLMNLPHRAHLSQTLWSCLYPLPHTLFQQFGQQQMGAILLLGTQRPLWLPCLAVLRADQHRLPPAFSSSMSNWKALLWWTFLTTSRRKGKCFVLDILFRLLSSSHRMKNLFLYRYAFQSFTTQSSGCKTINNNQNKKLPHNCQPHVLNFLGNWPLSFTCSPASI